jgi:hypothetical protein
MKANRSKRCLLLIFAWFRINDLRGTYPISSVYILLMPISSGTVVVRKQVFMGKDNIYIERRPNGNYAVEKPGAERASAILPTQRQAIERAREISPNTRPDVERVRHTSVGKPDQWRKA